MSIYRSEHMRLAQLFLSSEAAYSCVSELGELGLVQFRDLNPDMNSFQRAFVSEVRRCDDMERVLKYVEAELLKAGFSVADHGDNPPAPLPREMVDLEASFEKLETELKEVSGNAENLNRNFLELTELKEVLKAAQVFLDGEEDLAAAIPEDEGRSEPVQLGFLAGVIAQERLAVFERMVWRVSRGNAFLRQHEIAMELKDPATQLPIRKVVYMLFCQGEALKMKMKKVVEGCRATAYPCPDSAAERAEMLAGVSTRIQDLSVVLEQTSSHRDRVLEAAAKQLRTWLVKVRKMKSIYDTLNCLNVDVTNKCLIAECWLPIADVGLIKEALRKGNSVTGGSMEPVVNMVDSPGDPPTFFKRNKFTNGFQNLIEAYGEATYREVNPGLYTCASFPFLFAVMFGDCGHGLIMFMFALFMVLREKSLAPKVQHNEIAYMMFGGRYIILMMGAFSIYTGFIYNDIFSKSMNIFGSSWTVGTNRTVEILTYPHVEAGFNPGDPEDWSNVPYPVGIDPMWQLALNKISFLNTYKMKMSIIVGVSHMMFGVVLSIFNHIYFKRWERIFCEFIPQVVFLLALFGYLCVLVIIKWFMYGDSDNFDDDHGSYCAPAVLITFINMFLFKTDPPPVGCSPDSIWMFPGQFTIQMVFVIAAVVSIPIMLLARPFILKSRAKAASAAVPLASVEVEGDTRPITASSASLASSSSTASAPPPAPPGEHGHGDEFDFGEVMIHQAIHTIEYVLGSVSHTASYLRLWALSLAHAQLSEVLWSMVLSMGLGSDQVYYSVVLYAVFAGWAVLTIAILVVMEGLSAFLHTLRLHWVEFCSKFYEAQGYGFVPFNFRVIVNPGPTD